MINKKDFAKIKKDFDSFEKLKEELIKKSRDVVFLSKKLINSIHRNNPDKKILAEIEKAKKKLDGFVKKASDLKFVGAYKAAIQEYVEAITFYKAILEKKLPGHKELKVMPEYYILGLCDLTGELARRAVNAGIKKEIEAVEWIKKLISEIYAELSLFDFRNGETRRKFDSIKYDLKKVEELVFGLKLTKT